LYKNIFFLVWNLYAHRYYFFCVVLIRIFKFAEYDIYKIYEFKILLTNKNTSEVLHNYHICMLTCSCLWFYYYWASLFKLYTSHENVSFNFTKYFVNKSNVDVYHKGIGYDTHVIILLFINIEKQYYVVQHNFIRIVERVNIIFTKYFGCVYNI